MGGFGSGRGQRGKDTTEDSRPLDIRKLNRSDLFQPGRLFGWQWTVNKRPVSDIQLFVGTDYVVLIYKYQPQRNGEWEYVCQTVSLDRTPCHLGGMRCWWICPSCGRRVAVLYGPGKHYTCRHCLKLVYASQRETESDRAVRRADNIRRRLGWGAGIANPEGDKPKGIHWRTFERLKAEYHTFALASWEGMAEQLGLIHRRLDTLRLDLLENTSRDG